MSEQNLNTMLNSITMEIRRIVGAPLKEVILYGSYARGDFDVESDIDIALIVDIDRAAASRYSDSIVRLASDFGLENDVVISIHAIPKTEFDFYKEAMPYYRNINREGVRLYA